jgi:hypothetical protein
MVESRAHHAFDAARKGVDRIAARATNAATGETCRATISM